MSDLDHMLGALGRLWAAGTTTGFAGLLGKAGRRRVPLPTYRFERQRHWVEPGIGAATHDADAAGGKRADIGEWFYRPTWRQTQIAAPTASARSDARLRGRSRAGRAAGTDRACARRGRRDRHRGRRFARIDRDRFVVRADVPGDYVALLAALGADARVPARIHHLWSVTGAPRGDVFRAADRAQALGFTSLLHLAQALGAEDVASPVALVVVSDGMQRVGGEAAPSPAKATLLGPTRVIPRELPNVRATSVDIALPAAGSRAEAATIDALLAEPDAPDAAETVALRHGERWVQRFEAVAVPDAAPALRAGGTYVITGGLGGPGARGRAQSGGQRRTSDLRIDN